jgi:6-phosphogluconolactonase (cycloisomerase 2 family)
VARSLLCQLKDYYRKRGNAMTRSARIVRWVLPVLGIVVGWATVSASPGLDPSAPDLGGDLTKVKSAAVGAVYTMSNSAAGNEIIVFHRAPDGSLSEGDTFPTGGMGTGAGLGNQGGLVLDAARRRLFAVNAGSDEISVFSVMRTMLVLTDVVPSGGEMPKSLTVDGDLLYVLNAAGAGTITGFEVSNAGKLTPLAGSTRNLSGTATTDPAQIQFSPDGGFLVVTEKATNLIDVYAIDVGGLPSDPVVQPSSGTTPFGFDFSTQGFLIVSEAFGGAPEASAVSSYDLTADAMLNVVSPSVATTQTAACWIEVSQNGRFAYTTNTDSGTISGYSVNPQSGALTLLDEGVAAETGVGSAPIDMALSRDGRFLYVLNSGTDEIIGFEVSAGNRGLTPLLESHMVPDGANGLAVR